MGGTNAKDGLERIFQPRSIAVVGASRRKGTVGRTIFDNLLSAGFQGPVYPVNPQAREVGSVRAYPSVLDVPDEVDLAVIAVPVERALAAVEECGRKSVGGLVVVTAGFRETDEAGAARETALAEALQRYGMRAIGPNCMGVLNTHPHVRMNATFARAGMRHGKIAFVSQSGALGMAILERADQSGLGLSYFVSLGNKTNVSTNDLLAHWRDDPDVEIILLYLENFGNPRRFVELAREVGRAKPIIAVKSGRTAAGARAATSHTGALAERDAAAEALFQQCGVLRAQTIQELFDYARVFSACAAPRGNRVAVVTNSGGPGIMATDALLEQGLRLAELAPETQASLRKQLLAEASVSNPVDVIAGAGPSHFRAAVEAVLADPGVDMVVVIYTPPVFLDEAEVARAIIEPPRAGKPLVACVLGEEGGGASHHRLAEAGVPTYTFPEQAVRALVALHAHGERQRRPEGRVPELAGLDRARARSLVEAGLASGAGWMAPGDAAELLASYGIPTVRTRKVATAEEAAAAATQIGRPVALKAVAPGLVHKTEAGGVRLGVPPDEVAEAYEAMRRDVTRHGFEMSGALVQEMLRPGRETILGMSSDPKFGPLLMFGLGGVYVEVLKDVVFRLAPLTDEDARRMVRAIRGWPLLEGIRGEPAADVAAIEDALLRLSALVTDLPEVAEIDINPLVAAPQGEGAAAPDARVRLWPGGTPPRAPAVVPELAGGRHPAPPEGATASRP